MNTEVDASALQLARRIRLEREARGWPLAGLAERSGVSKAAISKIERGEVSPTAVVLVKLAGAFGMTLAALLVRAEGEAGRLSRRAGQAVWTDPATGYVRRQVFCRPDHPVEVVSVTLPPGQRVAFPASSYALIRQAVWVQAGELTVEEGGERHVLAAGDCLGFGAPADCVLANEGAAEAAYTVVLARS